MGELERLGNSAAFGYVLLEMLERAGWTSNIRAAFAGDGVIVSLWAHVRPEYQDALGKRLEFTDVGPSLASVICGLMQQCVEHRRYILPAAGAPIDADVQLPLPLA
jgi:hypothetical protein